MTTHDLTRPTTIVSPRPATGRKDSVPRPNPPSARKARRIGFSRSLLRRVGHVARLLFAGLLVLLGSGAVYESVAARADAQRFPPPGQLVDVSGHLLHLDVRGSGGPTVVLESGLGEYSLSWQNVQPELANVSRVVAYDRAGLGWSEPGPTPRTAGQVADELHGALHNAGIPGPYILVGHSTGAKNARLFASRYRDEVAGLVLVDGRHEDFDAFKGAAGMQRDLSMIRVMYGVLGTFDRVGILRVFGPGLLSLLSGPGFTSLGPDAVAAYAHFIGRPSMAEASLSELSSWEQTNAELAAAGEIPGNLPLAVISHGEPLPSEGEEAAWQAAQVKQATLSTLGRLVVAERSGHAIPLDRPDIIVTVVKEMIQANRGGTDA